MVTGIETAGLVLAVLPLVVKQLDDYAKGLNTIRSFGARRHRRDMNLYAAELGTQAALLTDSIMLLVEDIVDDTEVLLTNPHSSWVPILEKDKTQQRLQKRLGRNYDLYMKTMGALSETLLNLQLKLGLDTDALAKGTLPSSDQKEFLRIVKRFRDVFSKSVFDDLLSRIDRANWSLKALTENALREEKTSKRRRLQQKPLHHFSMARCYARTLHKAFLESSCRNNTDDHSHKLNFRIDDDEFSRIVGGDYPDIIFNVALMSQVADVASAAEPIWRGKELEIVPVKLDKTSSKQLLGLPASQMHASKLNPQKKVSFAPVIAPAASSCIPCPPPALPPVNLCERGLCTELLVRRSCTSKRECLGFFGKDFWKDHRHDVYLIRDLPRQLPSQPLLHSIVEAQNAPIWQATRHSLKLWTNRLRIAVLLAFSIMKLHGTWLRPFWKLKDVLLVVDDRSMSSSVPGQSNTQHLYLEWDAIHKLDLSQLTLSPSKSPLIRSDLLFPLGVALLELALCEPIENLFQPEDSDSIDYVAELKTALRLIDTDIVALHCGQRYGDVVRDCLLWNGKKDVDLDDEAAQQMVWEKIVLPLIEDLCAAEGKTLA